MPHDSNIITIYQSWAGKIFIQAPMREQQALDIASLIKEGHIVVLNLERCGSVESQKLLDFISGAAYAREDEQDCGFNLSDSTTRGRDHQLDRLGYIDESHNFYG